MKSKTKLVLLSIGITIALFMCYKLALSNTLALKKEYNELSSEVFFFNNIPEQLALLNKKKKYYDTLLSEMNLDNTSLENNLLRILNLEASKNNLKVIDFNNPHIHLDHSGIVNTHAFILQGSFTNILLTIHELESKGNFGEIIHTYFEKKKNYKTNKDFLTATIFIQNLK